MELWNPHYGLAFFTQIKVTIEADLSLTKRTKRCSARKIIVQCSREAFVQKFILKFVNHGPKT